jgi:molybdopterin synthase sulfur carrier subunit
MTFMNINILYFASLGEFLGKTEDRLTVSDAVPAIRAWEQLNPNIALPANTLVAINQEYASLDTILQHGDELAFFPPVTGG